MQLEASTQSCCPAESGGASADARKPLSPGSISLSNEVKDIGMKPTIADTASSNTFSRILLKSISNNKRSDFRTLDFNTSNYPFIIQLSGRNTLRFHPALQTNACLTNISHAFRLFVSSLPEHSRGLGSIYFRVLIAPFHDSKIRPPESCLQ